MSTDKLSDRNQDDEDIKLLERYQGFSGELLRLSLLGIALLGFFIDKVP